MIGNLFSAVFGCSHRRTTFPLTLNGNKKRTYVVCLDCGQEFNYSWSDMHMLQKVGKETDAASELSIVDSPSQRSAATANAIAIR